MRRVAFLLVVSTFAVVAFGATQVNKEAQSEAKQRKPSLPKKYIVEDGGYQKHRKTRALLSEYELRDRHRGSRQFPGVRSGGGYLYNRPVYTSSDHLAARPALPLTEVESHPLSNFPVHYTGDLEDAPKDEAAKAKPSMEAEMPAANVTEKAEPVKESDKKKEQPDQMKKSMEAEMPKKDVPQEKSAESAAVAVPPSAVVPVGKNIQAEQDLDKPIPTESEKVGSTAAPVIIVSQQETIAGKPPVAVE